LKLKLRFLAKEKYLEALNLVKQTKSQNIISLKKTFEVFIEFNKMA